MAVEHVAQAIFTYERAFLGTFSFTSGVNRLDFNFVENRPFFLAMHQQVMYDKSFYFMNVPCTLIHPLVIFSVAAVRVPLLSMPASYFLFTLWLIPMVHFCTSIFFL